MNYLFDLRGDCMSLMLTLNYACYKEIIDGAYKNRGGIEGQRDVLKASTAIRIRKRMIDDIKQGAVLPPVVIGAVIGNKDYSGFKRMDSDKFINWLKVNSDSISLIDGMQRTTAMISADKDDDLSNYKLRVEIWLAKSINHLIYRMLILNSGQVPWDIKRQLETVLGSILKKIKNDVKNITIFTQDDNQRRREPSQYQASDILELYLVFGSRKEKIDIKERLSDEFVRLDFIELTSDDVTSDLFNQSLFLLGELDSCFGKLKQEKADGDKPRFYNGKDLFASQPARVGFITATSLFMLGRPGSSADKDYIRKKWDKKYALLNNLIKEINKFDKESMLDFLALQTLSEKLTKKKVPRVGDYEREFFRTAFYTMYEDVEDLKSLEVCWNAF
jgi:hypothetical protein